MNVNFFQTTGVTSTGVDRIMSKTMVTLTKLSNPKVNVTPDWKQRKLDIELETAGYYAMASVTPFNKQ